MATTRRTGPFLPVLAAAILSGGIVCAQSGTSAAPVYRVTLLAPLPDVPGGAASETLNDCGQVAGTSGFSGVLWHSGIPTEIEPFPGYTGIRVMDINMAGQVVGVAPDFELTGFTRAFLFDNGKLIDLFPGLSPENGEQAASVAINDAGQIVGTINFWDEGFADYLERAFFWHKGETIVIDPLPGFDNSESRGVNNVGQLVGYSGNHVFLWQAGVISDLGPLGMAVNDINATGALAGFKSFGKADQHAAVFRDGRIEDLGTLGGLTSQGWAINGPGHVVGLSKVEGLNWPPHAALWRDGMAYDLHALVADQIDGVLMQASDINNAGQIAAHAWTGHGGGTAYLLTPVSLGDVTGDGSVDILDLLDMFANWGPCPPDTDCSSDLNNDEVTDASDLCILLSNWG